MTTFISESSLADITSTSLATVQKWGDKGLYHRIKDEKGQTGFYMEELRDIPAIESMLDSSWNEEKEVVPLRDFTTVELFAGAGGLALGMHLAGFKHVLLNEMDAMACQTLRRNHPEWNVLEEDIHCVDFTPLQGKIDLLTGGFPCQAFSYAGKRGGLNDARGTLFFELARAVKEIKPKVFLCENVKGLLSHDDGRTIQVIEQAIKELGYTLVGPQILKAIMYQVPQKRERLIFVAIHNDIAENITFHWPSPYKRIVTLKDAFYKGILYNQDVPESIGQEYPEKKKKILELVPEGGDWRNLPLDKQKEYMGASFYLGGGKTGMARRLSMDEPSLTLTCSPAQKQTERCHPYHTRPLTVREYARIQTFPDEWIFEGNMAAQYKQIGNAVPVNLAYAVGRSLIKLLNDIEGLHPEEGCFEEANRIGKSMLPPSLFEIDMCNLKKEYPDEILANPYTSVSSTDSEDNDLQPNKSVLISLVKNDYIDDFEHCSAKIYYTGKRFPSTVKLNKLYYFMPYVKKKGIRDLYLIKVARVGTKSEAKKDCNDTSLRIVFEIQFVRHLFDDFVPAKLKIWNTFTDTTLSALLAEHK